LGGAAVGEDGPGERETHRRRRGTPPGRSQREIIKIGWF